MCRVAVIQWRAERRPYPARVAKGPTWLLEGKPLPHLWENNRTASWSPLRRLARRRSVHERAIRTALLDKEAVGGGNGHGFMSKISMAAVNCC